MRHDSGQRANAAHSASDPFIDAGGLGWDLARARRAILLRDDPAGCLDPWAELGWMEMK